MSQKRFQATCIGNGPKGNKHPSPMFDDANIGLRAMIAPGTKVYLIEPDETGDMARVVTEDSRLCGWMYCNVLQLGGK